MTVTLKNNLITRGEQMSKIMEFFGIKPRKLCLDILFYRRYNREQRLKNFQSLDAPKIFIDKEIELVEQANAAIETRLKDIAQRVDDDRAAIAAMDIHDEVENEKF